MHALQERFQQQIQELARTANRLAELGYVTSQGGNLSMRVEEDALLITPTKVAKLDVRFEDICVITLQGNVLYAAPGRRPTGEWPFHTRIMRNRPDVRGIIHAHPPALTGFATAGTNALAKPYLPEPVLEVGPMVMVPYAVPLSEELAENFDHYIHRSNGFLMENHGALMVSPEGIGRALELLEMMEATARSLAYAAVLGGAKTLSRQDVADLEEVLRVRNLPMPGLPGAVEHLADIFEF
ncbi:MAG: class II aldolase/adducin family protein [Candidatus Excrementavichristensenella sp.]|jgi:L-fuculose-phosphate aldolase